MLDMLSARWRQGHRTLRFLNHALVLPDRFRGRPVLDPRKCAPDCHAHLEARPTDALMQDGCAFHLDLGHCLSCR
jgi:formate hydrogenlyase subunit 6/NADH:ubiquinone oxidoreductase subunit I